LKGRSIYCHGNSLVFVLVLVLVLGLDLVLGLILGLILDLVLTHGVREEASSREN
jgi:hypothetical protein